MRSFDLRRLVAFAVAAAGLLAAILTSSPSASAEGHGAVQLPATCIANIRDGGSTSVLETLNVGISTPEWPAYWDVTPFEGAWAEAHGSAVLTPSGVLNINCDQSSGRLVGDPIWPVGTTTQRVACGTALGSNPYGYGAHRYEGQGTVTVYNSGQRIPGTGAFSGRTTINCHATFSGTYPPPGG